MGKKAAKKAAAVVKKFLGADRFDFIVEMKKASKNKAYRRVLRRIEKALRKEDKKVVKKSAKKVLKKLE